MKNIIFIFIILPIIAFAQPRRDKMKSMRIAFITSELELTTEETSKFIPIFKAFDENQTELKRKMRILLDKKKTIEEMTDSEAIELLNQSEKIEEELFSNRKNLIKNLKDVLSAKKLLKLRKIELEFNKKLIKKIRDRE
jgi:hypothetical protein